MAEALWRASWQGGAFVLAVWIACRLFPGMGASRRGWLWWLACLKLLSGLMPPIAVALPLWPAGAASPAHPIPAAGLALPLQATPIHGIVGPASPAASSWMISAFQAAYLPTLGMLIAGLWAAGVLYRLRKLARGWRAACRLRAGARPLDDPWIAAEAARLSAGMGLRSAPLLLRSESAAGPLALGGRRPAIVLPAGAASRLASDELRMVLAHEVAHIGRRDLLLGWVPLAADLLFFFHPLARLACGEWRCASEEACDAAALATCGGDGRAYGRLLVKLASPPAGLVPSLAVSPDYLKLRRRLLMIQRRHATASRRARWGLAALITAGAFGALPLRVTAQGDADETMQQRSLYNLKRLGTALQFYTQDWDETYPPMRDAQAVRRALLPYVKDPSVFVQPATQVPYRPNAALSHRRVKSLASPADIVALYEASPTADGSSRPNRIVLFADTHAKTISDAEWQRMMRTPLRLRHGVVTYYRVRRVYHKGQKHPTYVGPTGRRRWRRPPRPSFTRARSIPRTSSGGNPNGADLHPARATRRAYPGRTTDAAVGPKSSARGLLAKRPPVTTRVDGGMRGSGASALVGPNRTTDRSV